MGASALSRKFDRAELPNIPTTNKIFALISLHYKVLCWFSVVADERDSPTFVDLRIRDLDGIRFRRHTSLIVPGNDRKVQMNLVVRFE